MAPYNSSNTTNTANNVCTTLPPNIVGITLALMATPVHVFVIRVLVMKLRLWNPRHMIIMNLSISDLVQILGRAIAVLATMPLNMRNNQLDCIVFRFVLKFLSTFSVVSSSGMIVALSLERYIACVHCLRVHVIVTNRRVKLVLCSVWVASFATGTFVVIADVLTHNYELPLDSDWYSSVYIIATCSSFVIMSYVQVTLYKLSKDIIEVLPSSFGAQAEEYYGWKQQIKISFAAGAMSVLYIICMFPKTVVFTFMKIQKFHASEITAVSVTIALMQLNVVVNPFVYGFLMPDVRKGIFQDLRQIRRFCWTLTG